MAPSTTAATTYPKGAAIERVNITLRVQARRWRPSDRSWSTTRCRTAEPGHVPLPCDPANRSTATWPRSPDLVPPWSTGPVGAGRGRCRLRQRLGPGQPGYGDATAENGILRHGFAVCDPITSPPPARCSTCPAPSARSSPSSRVGVEHARGRRDRALRPRRSRRCRLSTRATTPRAHRRRRKEVSEFNEVNNWLAGDPPKVRPSADHGRRIVGPPESPRPDPCRAATSTATC
jgi:hypothetical protein